MNKRHGFTLLELMVVLSILGLLAAIFVPLLDTKRNVSYQTLEKTWVYSEAKRLLQEYVDKEKPYLTPTYGGAFIEFSCSGESINGAFTCRQTAQDSTKYPETAVAACRYTKLDDYLNCNLSFE